MISGARKLPAQHITIRVPWHDAGWNGTVCRDPRANTHCNILKNIGLKKRDESELACASRSFEELDPRDVPPCIEERGTIMAPFEIARRKLHPYVKSSDKHAHFAETILRFAPYSAACVPFRWMLREQVEGNAEKKIRSKANDLMLGYDSDREPELPFKTAWIQDRDNQLVMLDTFFGSLEPRNSLCFFYAKRTPLAEDPRRVLVGVGRIVRVGEHTEYEYTTTSPPLRGVLWERNVTHSIRPGFVDGFLLPYAELIAEAERDPSLALEEYVAFAPDDFFENYSYGAEHLPDDGAIASLVVLQHRLEKIAQRVPGHWDVARKWIDVELGRLWKARGAFPGLGAALCAFGLQHGNLIAYELTAAQRSGLVEWTENPWARVDQMFREPKRVLSAGLANEIGDTFQKKWAALKPPRRALLELLSRGALSDIQATRYYQETERAAAGIQLRDDDILANPYVIYESDRDAPDAIAFATVDRGLFADEALRKAFPVPLPSTPSDVVDARRVRAVVIDTLEGAAGEGSTLLPRTWVIQRVRERAMEPGCPVDEDTLAVVEAGFSPHVLTCAVAGQQQGLQLDRFAKTRSLISDLVRRRVRGQRHPRKFDWDSIIEREFGALPDEPQERELEERARREKAAGLAELYASRFSVLIGPAGTGKTTLLRMLCAVDEITSGGLLLLAPTGKARVRLEEQTRKRGAGKTIAQHLLQLERYDGSTGRYFPNPDGPKPKSAKTVIVDECSMLTEEQLGALFDSLVGVERVILVGDPRQLPPIGAGRPFVDIVDELAPTNVEAIFPKCGSSYAELTVPRRQQGSFRDDLLLAGHFSGRPLDPGADEVWDRLARGRATGVRAVQWSDSNDLQRVLAEEIVAALDLGGRDEETAFELSLGGSLYGDKVYFWQKRDDGDGAASKADAWQVLSPVRGTLHGVDAINRAIQARFRKRARDMASPELGWRRVIPKALGPQAILWGDKVINVVNNGRRRHYPKTQGAYVANGDLGVAVGEFKTKKFEGTPANLEVEFATLPGVKFKYWDSEFRGDERSPPLELAYALTVHKTQGSEFKKTFVVIPNPCRMLSRELLYTALTRHREDLVVLHQGPLRDLVRYADETASEIAQRMTNLFRDAAPREVRVGSGKRFLEDRLIHRTERGELVRSKSEVIIADKLYSRRKEYAYEQSVVLDGVERFPDFTIRDDDAGVTFYWEHLGMTGDPGYAARWERKLAEYRRAVILPHDEGGGLNGTLIVTRDDLNGGLDSAEIARIIDTVLP